MSSSADFQNNPNTPFTSLLYDIGVLKDQQPNPGGYWDGRPIDDGGQQVKDGDILAVRCVIVVEPSWFDQLGSAVAMLPTQTSVDGVGDPNDSKGQGKWLTTKDKDGDGGSWYTITDGTSDSSVRMIVRNVDGRFQLELQGQNGKMSNHGDWVNTYPTVYDYPANFNITCFPTQYGYKMQFQSDEQAVTYSDYLNTKNSGAYVYFAFIHLGNVSDSAS